MSRWLSSFQRTAHNRPALRSGALKHQSNSSKVHRWAYGAFVSCCLLPPPAFGERRHRGLARRRVSASTPPSRLNHYLLLIQQPASLFGGFPSLLMSMASIAFSSLHVKIFV